MLISALVSGQAGLGVVLGSKPELRAIGKPSYIGTMADVVMALEGSSDVQKIEVGGRRALDRVVRRLADIHKAKLLLFIILDNDEDDVVRKEAAEELEKICKDQVVQNFILDDTKRSISGFGSSSLAKILGEEHPSVLVGASDWIPGYQSHVADGLVIALPSGDAVPGYGRSKFDGLLVSTVSGYVPGGYSGFSRFSDHAIETLAAGADDGRK